MSDVKNERQQRLEKIEEEIEVLQAERRGIHKLSLNGPESEKVCEDWIAEMSAEEPFPAFPVPANIWGVTSSGETIKEFMGHLTGVMVAVRPCAEEFKNKTFLGFLIGEAAIGVGATLNPVDGILDVHPAIHNPAILVPKLNKVIYGYESWWGEIKSIEDFRKITDEDISDVWYVKLWKEIHGEAAGDTKQEQDQ